ncbi:slr1658 superfamily regulator [Agrobacterium tumefaciens]|uniref:slr1658 superfamily regulator n=1 Tax=Agrobacterium tumefaciens TaxID=358 RepID=UPI00287F2B1C|nr:hypothetical protein [Agrobacterium tumefaciens]MDS7594188.1 hypothetical protein [Agrobacterium tumefaciens]
MARVLYGAEELIDANLEQGARLILCDGPLQIGWRHSGLTSDFIAEVMSMPYAFAKNDYAVVHHSIAYLTNELIENAVKFRLPSEIVIEACLAATTVLIRVKNAVDAETSVLFQHKLRQILDRDPGELLIQQIEANALSDDNASGLGLLTLLSDYGARMAWEFDDVDERSVILTTTAEISIPIASNM